MPQVSNSIYYEVDDVREAARDTVRCATEFGGWWTLSRTERGNFSRGGRYADQRRGCTPMLHVRLISERCNTSPMGMRYALEIERAEKTIAP